MCRVKWQEITEYKTNGSIRASMMMSDIQHQEPMGALMRRMTHPLRHGHSLPCRHTGTVYPNRLIFEKKFGIRIWYISNLMSKYLQVIHNFVKYCAIRPSQSNMWVRPSLFLFSVLVGKCPHPSFRINSISTQ